MIRFFTSHDNSEGNTETERMKRTLKEEVIWLEYFNSLTEVKEKTSHWIEYDYTVSEPFQKNERMRWAHLLVEGGSDTTAQIW